MDGWICVSLCVACPDVTLLCGYAAIAFSRSSRSQSRFAVCLIHLCIHPFMHLRCLRGSEYLWCLGCVCRKRGQHRVQRCPFPLLFLQRFHNTTQHNTTPRTAQKKIKKRLWQVFEFRRQSQCKRKCKCNCKYKCKCKCCNCNCKNKCSQVLLSCKTQG